MDIKDMKRAVKLREWSEMILACQTSGRTVSAWCETNGITIKTYYYRLRRVRLAALKEPEANTMLLAREGSPSPLFAELDFFHNKDADPCSKVSRPAVTLRIGKAMIDIHNGAEADVVTNTLHAIRSLC